MDISAWIGLWTFIGMFLLLMLGVPIFISLLATAFIGSWLLGGPAYTLQQFANAPYNILSNYTLAVMPLFILMSVLAANCGIAQNAYQAASKWFGGFRGGLLMATVGSAAVFGASCGASIASSAVFAKTALPELEKYKYDKSISMGCIAVAGNLASLIPPSVGIIVICILIDASIGRGLIAGIIPGILLSMLLISTILLIGLIKPKTVPKLDGYVSWKEKFTSLALIGPVLFIILLVIGGMYLGFFAPTVGGAIGSAGVLLIAIFRRIKISVIMHSFFETGLMNAQLFPLILGGFLFARFIAFSGLPEELLQIIINAHFPPMMLMLAVIIFYLFIGCVLEFMSMAIITLPIVYPLLTGVGFDPTATIIILILLGEIALITPPIGMTVFLISGVAKVSPVLVFRGVIPFIIPSMILLWLIVFFPQIATWLPNFFYGIDF